MTRYQKVRESLLNKRHRWCITGVAGFIGSHLLEELLNLNQEVVGVDNFSTGNETNLQEVRALVGEERWLSFKFIKGDICDYELMLHLLGDVDIVLHQAALGSVPRSLEDPLSTNKANVEGFVSVITAAKQASVKRFIYASSSSVYGDSSELPKIESRIGRPLSPYAASKQANESYADAFAASFELPVIGLRYFNVFGPRQDPKGPYAAVIPRWISEQASGNVSVIYGDGSNSRDFCYVRNVVEANILAALVEEESSIRQVYNIALGNRTTLLQLYEIIRSLLIDEGFSIIPGIIHVEPRTGDIPHSLADISKAQKLLGYSASISMEEGMKKTVRYCLGKVLK